MKNTIDHNAKPMRALSLFLCNKRTHLGVMGDNDA